MLFGTENEKISQSFLIQIQKLRLASNQTFFSWQRLHGFVNNL
jgi:hypothetical protein